MSDYFGKCSKLDLKNLNFMSHSNFAAVPSEKCYMKAGWFLARSSPKSWQFMVVNHSVYLTAARVF